MQDVYSQTLSSLRKLVLAELVEERPVYSADDRWSMGFVRDDKLALSAHLYIQKPGAGLPDVQTYYDLGAGRHRPCWPGPILFSKEFDKVNPLVSRRMF